MSGNSFGHIFRLTSFGESHGYAIGGIIDGCPSNIELNLGLIQQVLDKRKPGQSQITTERKEEDKVEFLSGIFEGKTLGSPIAFIIKNKDQKSDDYDRLKEVFRPSHADFTWQHKFGIRDHRGGGRSSARETIARVVAGAIAQQILEKLGIKIFAYVSQIGNVSCTIPSHSVNPQSIESNPVRCPEADIAEEMMKLINQVKEEGDSIGGKITAVIKGTPIGLGEPVFDKLNADLAKAMMSINAAKGFELGSGFDCITMRGSEHNDQFIKGGSTSSNFSGGIQGGISNGQDIYFNVAFKPVATIKSNQSTIDVDGNETQISVEGRHDPCVVPRAVPIVEAMTAMVLLDHCLRKKTNQL